MDMYVRVVVIVFVFAIAAVGLGCTVGHCWAVAGITKVHPPNAEGGRGRAPEALLPVGGRGEVLFAPAAGAGYGIQDMRAHRWVTVEDPDGLSFLEGVAAVAGGVQSCEVWLKLRNDSRSALEVLLHEARLSDRDDARLSPELVATVMEGSADVRYTEDASRDAEASVDRAKAWVVSARLGETDELHCCE